MKTYTVHCLLPQGTVLSVLGADFTPETRVMLNGVNLGVPAAFWEKWVAENAGYGPYKAGQIMGTVDEAPEPVQPPKPASAPQPKDDA